MSIPSWARKGAKVARVRAGVPFDDNIGAVVPDARVPAVGEVCTVADAYMHGMWGATLSLAEYPENEFALSGFRPLTEISESDDTEARIFHSKGLTVKEREREINRAMSRALRRLAEG